MDETYACGHHYAARRTKIDTSPSPLIGNSTELRCFRADGEPARAPEYCHDGFRCGHCAYIIYPRYTPQAHFSEFAYCVVPNCPQHLVLVPIR